MVNRGYSPDDRLEETYSDVPETCEGTYRQRRISLEEEEEDEFQACCSRAESPELELYVPCEDAITETSPEPFSLLPSNPDSIQINIGSPLVTLKCALLHVSVLILLNSLDVRSISGIFMACAGILPYLHEHVILTLNQNTLRVSCH